MSAAITITAWRRTAEFKRALESAIRSDLPLLSAVDAGEPETQAVYDIATEYCCVVFRQNPPLGLWGNPNCASNLYDTAFYRGYGAVIAIEDDCVLSVDAVDLCFWFLNKKHDYTFLSIANCNKPDVCLGRELDVVESNRIDSPWAWCFTRRMWETRLRPQWNWRTEPPVGWDWSLTSSMEKYGWKALCPVLPRAKNIGRELGANGGREIFDQTLALAAFSDGSWGNDFRIVK